VWYLSVASPKKSVETADERRSSFVIASPEGAKQSHLDNCWSGIASSLSLLAMTALKVNTQYFSCVFFVYLFLWGILFGGSLFAVTPHTINVDGDISDFSPDELILDDPDNDSLWANNEINEIYLTWDTNKLYMGYVYKLQDNAIIIPMNFSLGDGMFDINSSPSWARNFQFSGVLAEVMFVNWNADATIMNLLRLRSNTDEVGPQDLAVNIKLKKSSDQSGMDVVSVELEVEWNTLYGLGPGKVIPGASLYLVAIIAGGDNANGGDSAPHNESVDGDGPGLIRRYFSVSIDANTNGVPDKNVSPATAGKIVEFEKQDVRLDELKVSPRVFGGGGGKTEITFTANQNGIVEIEVFNESGRLVRKLAKESVVENQSVSFSWDGKDDSGQVVGAGVHIIRVLVNNRLRKKVAVVVVK